MNVEAPPKKKLTRYDLSPDSKIPLDAYHPAQRGFVAERRKALKEGPPVNHRLKNDQWVVEECPYCVVRLRVKRGKKGPIMLYCPCGYEEPANKGAEIEE